MRGKLPASPLATRFSSPARETEARLRSLFRFKRKPPAALVALTLAAALFCGGLVSCQKAESPDLPVPSESAPESAPAASVQPVSRPAPEEYVQETHPIRVMRDGEPAELTLKLHIASDPEEHVDQIVVWDGRPVQTIEEYEVNLDEDYLFEGLYGGFTDIRDVNFDGSEDFGVLCGRTYNGPVCWFTWDEEEGQFHHAFFSGLDLRLDPERRRQTDYWRDGNIGGDVYVYEYDGRGERTLAEHQRYDGEFPPA